MAETSGEPLKRRAYAGVLAAGFLLSLAAGLPGQMSVDSIIALEEARSNVRQTWAPAAFSAVLRAFDAIVAGTGVYVAASTALLFASLMSLPALRGRTSWGAVAVAALAALTPQLLIYQGIVWRDVLFANLVVAGFVLLARADSLWGRRPPWLSLAGAALSLALAAAVRQNGIVLVVFAGLALGWVARPGGWPARIGWAVGGILVTTVLAFAINLASQPAEKAAHLRPGAEALILQHYDIVGAVAHDPGLNLKKIAAVNPQAAQRIATQGPKVYTPARVDTLDLDPDFRRTLWKLPDATVAGQWEDIVEHHTGAYLAHRMDVFRWTFLTPDLKQCLPVQIGVEGPEGMIEELELDSASQPRDAALKAYAQRFYGTPVFNHLTFAVIALIVAGSLLMRRQPGDVPVAGLLVGALAFTLSFLPISVACDYRYLYLLDLAAIAGAIYLALDLRLVVKVRARARAVRG